MPDHYAFSEEDIDEKIEAGKVGDRITYQTDNQEGTKIYEIVLKDGKKNVKLIGNMYGLFKRKRSSSSSRGSSSSRSRKHKKSSSSSKKSSSGGRKSRRLKKARKSKRRY